jgi:hypothetical protein
MDYQQRTGRKNLRRPAPIILFPPRQPILTPEVFDGWFREAA